LAAGKLPILSCTRCGDLKRASRSEVREPNHTGNGHQTSPAKANKDVNGGGPARFSGPKPRLPYRGMLLENTVRCNIDCLGCDRQSAARIRTSKQMDLEQLSTMADLVHELKLEKLFYLNLGEPFLSPNIGQELPLLRKKNPDCHIIISSNAILLNNDSKREAALSASHIFFSIAGIDDDMLKKYEKYGSFEKAYANMKALVEYRNARGLSRPFIEWKYLLFNWNDRREVLDRAIRMAKAAKVDAISFWPTSNPAYGYSFRYRLGLLDDIGVANWKGRELDLRLNPKEPLTL